VTPLRVGIAGAGFAAKFHLENFGEAGVEVVGVTSARAESRDAFAAAHGLRAFASVAEMLPAIDVLDICTPPSSHREYMLAAAAARKHVIVEKPLTGFFGSPREFTKRQMLDAVVAEARTLRDAFGKAGVTLGYAENFVMRLRCRKSARSWRRRARRFCGWWARSRTTARTRRCTGSGASRAAGR